MGNTIKFDQKNFTMLEAINEAKRCLKCKNAQCKKHCPIDNDIPDFIHQLSKGNLGEAREILAKKTNLPSVCGRVCPHEKQCEGNCILNKTGKPIKIGKLEQFIGDFDSEMALVKDNISSKTRGQVAVIGSGPAGLTVAGDLSAMGFNVTVFEREPEPGGVLMYGIPEFRLPKYVVRWAIQRIEAMGVTFITNRTVGEDVTVDELFKQNFDAVFIGTGTSISKVLELPGDHMGGIHQSSYLLRMAQIFLSGEVERDGVPLQEGDNVVVIGGGNVAMDAARMSVSLGAGSVTVVYRKTREDMPALDSEYQLAVNDGVKFLWNTSPVEYTGTDGKINGLVVNKEGVIQTVPADKVFIAVGSKPAGRIVSSTAGIDIDENGYVITKIKPYGMTTKKGVFAGGDVVHKPATVVLAMKEAKKVAEGIAAYVDAVKLLEL